MVIKCIDIAGFKNIPLHTPKRFEFYYDTVIRGENFTGKTSLGDALCWVFSGCSSNGITADYILRNNDSPKAIVEVIFEDNLGQIHTLLREQKQGAGKNTRLILDGMPAKETDLAPYIMNSDVFLSTFMIGYFARLSPKQARELMMSVLPFPTHQNIINRVDSDVRPYLPVEDTFDSNEFLKNKRSALKSVESEIRLLEEKKKQAEEQTARRPTEEPVDETPLSSRVKMLEARRDNLIKASMQDNPAGYLEGKLSVLRLEMQTLRNKLSSGNTQFKNVCPTCNQPFPEEEKRKMQEKIQASNTLINTKLEELKKEELQLIEKIKNAQDKSNELKAIQEELASVENELKLAREDYDKIIRRNETIKSEKKHFEDSLKLIESSNEALNKLCAERYKINRSLVAVSQYNSIKADIQYETVRSSLKNVSIRLQKVIPGINELRDCFEILYKGRELQQISTSEVIRAGLEISKLINRRTGLKLPVFIDNAESITHYDKPDTQIFEARVERDAPLTIINNS
jgi:DNA repair exonuclease SbcCD ATPase subunit